MHRANERSPAPPTPAMVVDIARGLLAGAAAALFLAPSILGKAPLDGPPAAAIAGAPTQRLGQFGAEAHSADAEQLANWIAQSRDSGNAGFVIVDKKEARLHVFDANARLRASTPVLLGAAYGDRSVPDIGSRRVADVRPEERTTPAGRFVGEYGRNASGEDVVWVDYEAAVSMHRVRATNPQERRLERLASSSAVDNRISYGCINVPAAFFDAKIRPLFATQRAMVYVMPDVESLQQVFERVGDIRLAQRS